MKIVKSDNKAEAVDKVGTIVGEVYTLNDTNTVLFRCQGGFANLGSGGFTAYEQCRGDFCWVHQPRAELHLNN